METAAWSFAPTARPGSVFLVGRVVMKRNTFSEYVFSRGTVHGRSGETVGYVSPPVSLSTAVRVKEMKNGGNVVLRGRIIRRKDRELYVFEDSSGTIDIRIESGNWNGVVVASGEMIEIGGTLDKGMLSTAVHVERVMKI